MCYVIPPKQIDAERFHDMLGVLPPQNWHALPGGGEYFQLCEWYSEDYTSYFVRTGDNRYIEFRDHAWMKPSQVMELLASIGGCAISSEDRGKMIERILSAMRHAARELKKPFDGGDMFFQLAFKSDDDLKKIYNAACK